MMMTFNKIKCHVNTFIGLVGGMHSLHPPLCPRLDLMSLNIFRRP